MKNKKLIKNIENIHKLAEDTVNSWDMDTLIQVAIEGQVEVLSRCTDEEFQEYWNDFYNLENEDLSESELQAFKIVFEKMKNNDKT